MDIQALITNAATKLTSLAVEYGPKVVLAVVVLFIGWRVINALVNQVKKAFERSKMDVSLRPFLTGLTRMALRIVLLISVAELVGIKTTSFIAVLGAASLAVGLALQGALSNFAGGVLILIFRPFRVGDLVETQGHVGIVQRIDVLVTFLETPQNQTIILPNGPLINGNIINHSAKENMRLDIPFGVSYDADIDQTRAVVLEAVKDLPGVLKDPAPGVVLTEMADSSVNFVCNVFISGPDDYWGVYFGTREAIKKALDKAAIEIPFPQRVVHLKKEGE